MPGNALIGIGLISLIFASKDADSSPSCWSSELRYK
jgi:hypothetical protein